MLAGKIAQEPEALLPHQIAEDHHGKAEEYREHRLDAGGESGKRQKCRKKSEKYDSGAF